MTKLTSDDVIILIGAFRYALGRLTYVVRVTVDRIIRDWSELPSHTQDLIQEEVEFAFERNDVGQGCDREQWQRILDL